MQSTAVFVISLKRSPERRDYIAAQLNKQGINFSFFDAIDGNDQSNPLFKRYNYKKRLWLTSGKMPSKGEMGCYGSHYSLWQKCVDLNQPVIVVEDDAGISANAAEALALVEKKIQQYGFIRLEPIGNSDTITMEQQQDYCIEHINSNFWGARCYAIAPWAAQKLLNGSQRWSIPVDNYIGKSFIHGVESYYLTPNLIEDVAEFETTIQIQDGYKTPLHRKPSRELYTAYCQLRHFLHNRKFKKSLKVN